MIRGFRHKGLARFFDAGSTAGIQSEHAARLRLILGRLNAATCFQDMNLPGLRLHRLKGKRSGTWAVDVSGNWRVTFRFAGDKFPRRRCVHAPIGLGVNRGREAAPTADDVPGRLTRKMRWSRMDSMAAKADTVKAKARELIEQLPENATWDDVAYEIAVRRSIERGLADLDAGRTYTSKALLESLDLSE